MGPKFLIVILLFLSPLVVESYPGTLIGQGGKTALSQGAKYFDKAAGVVTQVLAGKEILDWFETKEDKQVFKFIN